MIGVSTDKPEAQKKFKEKYHLPFTLLADSDKKVVEAKEEIAGFYKQRLPSQYSAISAEVGKLANANGIKIAQAKFHPEETDLGALRPVTIDALLAGDYVHLMKFINAIERDPLLFIVDSIQLGDAQGGNVKLQLKMQTYLQSGA